MQKNKVKEMLKTTGRLPVIRKHVEEGDKSFKNNNNNKRKNIDGENSSGKRRKMLNNLGSKIVQNALYRKRRKRNVSKNNCNDDLDQHISTRTIQIGDKLNLSDLLFTKKRNYLINYKQNKPVGAKDLAGRVTVLHFMSLLDLRSKSAVITHLLDLYTKLQPGGGFEIVFVAISDDRDDIFSDYTKQQLSQMPWPAIPLSDLKSRQRLQRIFGISKTYMPPSFIIDPRGVVLQCHSTPLFIRYGAAGYPFTNERIEFLDSEDNVVQMQPVSIQKLLTSPQRDYLIDNDGEQVLLDYLDDKVVGLYFCPYLHQSYPTEEFDVVYDKLLETRETFEEFEIVLIYVQGWYEDYDGRTDEAMFLKAFKSMPWLALPFDDTDCNKKLQRIFKYPQTMGGLPPNPRLVIIGPHGKYIEPLGGNIMLEYGAPAYPFTTSSTVSLELERVKKLKLEMLWDLDSLFTHNDGSQVLFSQLIGKRIIVIFQKPDIPYKYTVKKLIERYFKMKGTDDEFEVIHILGKDHFAAPVPWLIHPPFNSYTYAHELVESIFRRDYGLLAFDRDGSVVRRTKVVEFGDGMIFPFYHNQDMDKEVLMEVEECITFRIRGDDDGVGTVYV